MSAKPVFETRYQAVQAINSNPQYRGCSPVFISDHYAASHGVTKGGWYLYSRQSLPWTVK